MASILPFTTARRRRTRPMPPRDALRGEIVIFSGVRIERIPDQPPAQKGTPVKAGA